MLKGYTCQAVMLINSGRRGRVSVQVTEIKDPMKQGVLKIACITLTHLYVYIHKEIYESNLTKILSYLRVMAFQVSH